MHVRNTSEIFTCELLEPPERKPEKEAVSLRRTNVEKAQQEEHMTKTLLLFEIDSEDADIAEVLVEGKTDNHSQRLLVDTDGLDVLPRQRSGRVLQ